MVDLLNTIACIMFACLGLTCFGTVYFNKDFTLFGRFMLYILTFICIVCAATVLTLDI